MKANDETNDDNDKIIGGYNNNHEWLWSQWSRMMKLMMRSENGKIIGGYNNNHEWLWW